jgi:hypothetical protein
MKHSTWEITLHVPNYKYRMATKLYALEAWFVSGIYNCKYPAYR